MVTKVKTLIQYKNYNLKYEQQFLHLKNVNIKFITSKNYNIT